VNWKNALKRHDPFSGKQARRGPGCDLDHLTGSFDSSVATLAGQIPEKGTEFHFYCLIAQGFAFFFVDT
jgi:hypothetical protein